MASNAEELTCVSIIVCDDVFRDEATKKQVIVGTFNQIRAVGGLPHIHPKLCILFTLTNGHGEYDLSVALEHERTGEEVLRVNGPLRIDDPLQTADFDLQLHGVPFPEEGKYWVVLRSGERVLQQRPLFVTVLPAEVQHEQAR